MELILVLAAEAEGKEATWKAEVSQKKRPAEGGRGPRQEEGRAAVLKNTGRQWISQFQLPCWGCNTTYYRVVMTTSIPWDFGSALRMRKDSGEGPRASGSMLISRKPLFCSPSLSVALEMRPEF